jgi:hypothetical protein
VIPTPRRRRRRLQGVTDGNGRWWGRRADERDQRHPDDRRAARASDHLHGGDPDHAEVDRRAAPDPNPSIAPANATSNQIVLEVNGDGTYSINTEKVTEDRLGPRLKEIYENRPEKIIFVKATPR